MRLAIFQQRHQPRRHRRYRRPPPLRQVRICRIRRSATCRYSLVVQRNWITKKLVAIRSICSHSVCLVAIYQRCPRRHRLHRRPSHLHQVRFGRNFSLCAVSTTKFFSLRRGGSDNEKLVVIRSICSRSCVSLFSTSDVHSGAIFIAYSWPHARYEMAVAVLLLAGSVCCSHNRPL